MAATNLKAIINARAALRRFVTITHGNISDQMKETDPEKLKSVLDKLIIYKERMEKLDSEIIRLLKDDERNIAEGMEAFEYLDKTINIMHDLEKRLQIISPKTKCVIGDPNNQASLIGNCNIQSRALPQTDSIRESEIVDLNESQPPSLIVSKIITEISELKVERNNIAFQTDSLKIKKINDLNNVEILSHMESNKIYFNTKGHESNIMKSLCCIIFMTAESLPPDVFDATKLCSHACIILNVERNKYLEYNLFNILRL